MPLPGEKNIQVISKLFALKSHLETNSTFPTLFPHLTVQSFPRAQTKANTISIKRLAEVSRSRKLLKSQSKLNKKKRQIAPFFLLQVYRAKDVDDVKLQSQQAWARHTASLFNPRACFISSWQVLSTLSAPPACFDLSTNRISISTFFSPQIPTSHLLHCVRLRYTPTLTKAHAKTKSYNVMKSNNKIDFHFETSSSSGTR